MDDDFISFALHEVRRGLAEAVVAAGLHLKPDTLAQAAARRVKARMKELEIILRRLIVLIALSLTLAPAKPRAPKPKDAEAEPVLTKSQPLWNFALAGETVVCSLDGPAFPGIAGHVSGPAPAAPLLRRFDALARILRAPERYARRVARVLERRRRAGEALPICQPSTGTHRLRPELGAIATGLPAMLAAAFQRWNDSG
ncbi:MAG TPA: hypothetical protein PLR76_14785 [Hyphomonas sp.]|nr:hypothetical protein [Hyphomonas sp.]MCB9961364.1 hypothetical protein [Hyphomonas sp.]MCB9971539.1 hypothetical protein [Hyphomonas sp.]HPE49667.1 hypothetical protein [Hyphomonas sp.]